MRPIDWTAASVVVLAAACGGDAGSKSAERVDSPAVATASAAPASAAPAREMITFRGLDSIRVGESAALLPRAPGDDPACRYVRPPGLPAGVKVMVVNDTVVRIDVDSGSAATERGIAVGSADSAVRVAYGSALSVMPNKYRPAPAHDLVVTSPDDTLRRMVFESDGAAVTRYRVGVRPAVDYVEGCG